MCFQRLFSALLVVAVLGCGSDDDGFVEVTMKTGGRSDTNPSRSLSDRLFDYQKHDFLPTLATCEIPWLALEIKGPPGPEGPADISIPGDGVFIDTTNINPGFAPLEPTTITVLVPRGPGRRFSVIGGFYEGCANGGGSGVKSYLIFGQTPPIDVFDPIFVPITAYISRHGLEAHSTMASIEIGASPMVRVLTSHAGSGVTDITVTDSMSGFKFITDNATQGSTPPDNAVIGPLPRGRPLFIETDIGGTIYSVDFTPFGDGETHVLN